MAKHIFKDIKQIVEKHNNDIEQIGFDELGIVLKWDDYYYDIPWSQMQTPLNLLYWARQLSQKSYVDTERLAVFIEKVCGRKNWRLTL